MIFLEENLIIILISAFFIWNGLIVVVSIIYRKKKKEKQPPFDDTSLEFDENWVSGYSGKNFYTRMGGASKCLTVSVNNREIYIRTFFPFNLLFLPEIFDLEHRIPKEDIVSVTSSNNVAGKETVTVIFSSKNKERSVVLYLNRPEEFLSVFSKPAAASQAF